MADLDGVAGRRGRLHPEFDAEAELPKDVAHSLLADYKIARIQRIGDVVAGLAGFLVRYDLLHLLVVVGDVGLLHRQDGLALGDVELVQPAAGAVVLDEPVRRGIGLFKGDVLHREHGVHGVIYLVDDVDAFAEAGHGRFGGDGDELYVFIRIAAAVLV